MAALTAISWIASAGGVGRAWPIAVYGCAGLDLPAGAETLTGVQDKTILSDLAGGVSIEQVISADAVQRETVTGVSLAIGEDGLVAEPGVTARSAEEIRMHARTQDGELREAAGSERCLLNGQLVNHVAIGGVHLVHQGHRRHLDRGADRANLQAAIDGTGAVSVHQDLRVGFGLESFLGERERVGARGKIGDRVRTVCLGVFNHLEVGGYIARPHSSLGHGGARGSLTVPVMVPRICCASSDRQKLRIARKVR